MAKKPKKTVRRGRDDAGAPACQDPRCLRRHFVVMAMPLPDGRVYYLCMRCWIDGARPPTPPPPEQDVP